MRISPEMIQRMQAMLLERSLKVTEKRVEGATSVKNTGAAQSEYGIIDEVHLSPELRLIEMLRKLVMQMPAVDEGRVRKIAERIASGEYRVDSSAVADAIIRELIGEGQAE